MKRTIILIATACWAFSAASVGAQETPFAQPSADYLKGFSKPGVRMFVYERYDADGKLYARTVEQLQKPVETVSAIVRKINGTEYRLRGLKACPDQIVTYRREEWPCDKAAIDAQSMIYRDRASVVLCKTLQLKSEPGKPDPVSCFSLVGDGTSNDPYGVSYDDDDVVFLGFAAIRKNDKGQSMRPDLDHSAKIGDTWRQN